MEIKNLNETPWLNKDGSFKSDAEIIKLKKTWGKETWQRYLDADVGTVEDENLVFFPYMDTETMSEGSEFLAFLQRRRHHPNVHFALEMAFDGLSRAEKSVLEKYFWKEKTHSEIAKKLKISSSTVRVLKGRAIKKLKKILLSEKFTRKLHSKKRKGKSKEKQQLKAGNVNIHKHFSL